MRQPEVPLPNSERTLVPEELERLGARPDPNRRIAADEEINVTVVVRPGAERPESPTRNKLRSARRPTDGDVEKVVAYAKDRGLAVVDRDRPPRMVVLRGTVEDMTGAFGTKVEPWVEIWRGRDHEFRLRRGQLSVPRELDGIVDGVLGLDNRCECRMHLHTRGVAVSRIILPPPTSAGVDGHLHPEPRVVDQETRTGIGYLAEEMATIYDYPTDLDGTPLDGSGQTVAVLAFDGRLDRAQLDAHQQRVGLPSPEVIEVPVDRPLTELGENRDGDVEVALDVTILAAIVPKARIGIYYADNTSQGFVIGLARAIYDNELAPSVVVICWGDREESWSQQGKEAVNDLLQDAAALGITVCCASGDQGSWDGAPDRETESVDFPGSSPFVLCCGGTQLVRDRGPEDDLALKSSDGEAPKVLAEKVWWDEDQDEPLGSGGGASRELPKPAWQHQLDGDMRRLPDIAGHADARMGYEVGQEGMLAGGTSAAVPLCAGLIIRINQALGRHVGFMTPLLYELDERAFRDITEGDNGAWRAQKGWDACTGRGRPRGKALLEELRARMGARAAP
jgi:kumamolisin